ncbi:PilT/PilU family type 4a pilus ATPase [Thermodesulfovibrio sp. 3462-1]|jgi:twitching motility protein PilT|uniref:Twitching motility protein n=2 Tax=Thermodesulfovibrio TaxID=28261 RepID=A0A2J6WIU7_9BACT|nr:MAG: twitching motility protein [Thermodesulfovibrio aggregans]
MRKQELDWILDQICESYPELSDIVFTVGRPFQVLQWGELKPVYLQNVPIQFLTAFHTERIALALMNNQKRLIENLLKEGYCDTSYAIAKARFRVNIFSQRGNYAAVLRKLPMKIPTVEELKLPPIVKEIVNERMGLVLVTGATGSGKSSTLAAMLEIINETRACHVITLEDPVEFVHQHKKSTFNQRELGIDFHNFADGLRAALRQAPHVILVGEIRDRETLEIAMQAAETGHLVLGTLHTTDAGQTIGRMIGMFPPQDENYIRLRVADTLKWVVSQRLLPKIGGGRIIATEVMRKNLRIRELIINGETAEKTFYDVIATSGAVGMHTFDQSILELYRHGLITEETAVAYASRRSYVIMEIDKMKAARGEKTTDIEGLKLDIDYGKKVKG